MLVIDHEPTFTPKASGPPLALPSGDSAGDQVRHSQRFWDSAANGESADDLRSLVQAEPCALHENSLDRLHSSRLLDKRPLATAPSYTSQQRFSD